MDDNQYSHILDVRGVVKPEHVDDLLIEVVSGRYMFEVGQEIYASRLATRQELDTARLIYRRRFNECKTRGLRSRNELLQFAQSTRLLKVEDSVRAKSIEHQIERLQDAMGKIVPSTTHAQALQSQIDTLNKEVNSIRLAEQSVLAHSIECRAEEAKAAYMVYATTMAGEFLDVPAWNTWEDYQSTTDLNLLIHASTAHYRVSAGLPVNVIRGLARAPQWRHRFKAAKDSKISLFDGAVVDWDINKINLITWSEFYDSVLSHPDLPSKALIHDDVALQKWINEQLQTSKNPQGKKSGSGRQPVTYIANGQRKTMNEVSRSTTNVGQKYRV
jgi:hypothetical protein